MGVLAGQSKWVGFSLAGHVDHHPLLDDRVLRQVRGPVRGKKGGSNIKAGNKWGNETPKPPVSSIPFIGETCFGWNPYHNRKNEPARPPR